MNEEIWKPIAGYEGCFEVSSIGRVRSVSRIVRRVYPEPVRPRYQSVRERILAAHIRRDRYAYISLNKENKGTTFAVHRLVAVAFHENPENKPEVNHKDFNRLNNRSENLEWVTRRENLTHAADSNRRAPLKMTREIAIEIRALRESGLSYSKIARLKNVSHKMIRSAVVGVRWQLN